MHRFFIVLFLFPAIVLSQTNIFPSDGNVGIGTASPIKKLHVYSTNTYETGLIQSSQKGSNLRFIDNSAKNIEMGSENGDAVIRTDNTIRLIVESGSGNIGVGTKLPQSLFHVNGRTTTGYRGMLHLDWSHDTNWEGSSNRWAGYIGFNAYRNNDDTQDYYFGTNKYTNKGVFEGSNYGFRWLYRQRINSDSEGQHKLEEYMRLTNNGDLGIGTVNPDAKLAVKGDIHAHEVKVDLNGTIAPDYVFKEDYDLKTLEEVENHIKQKGHLPNIPSAKEMEAEGVKLKEMNLKLLEKVEELTLYVIDQQKQIKAQGEEIAKLKEIIKD